MVMTVIAVSGLALSLLGIGLKVSLGVSAFSSISSALSLNKLGQYKNFDQPVSDILTQCILMISRFEDYVQVLIIFFSFLLVIFTSIKLWFGMSELKKAFADMILKCVMVTALTLIWPTVITKTYSLASHFGVEAAGGSELLANSFASVAGHTQKIVKEGTSEYIEALKTGALKENGVYKISDKALKAFTGAGMTEEEAKQWLANNGVKVSSDAKRSGFWIFSNAQKKAEDKANKSFKNDNTIVQYDEMGNPMYISGLSKQKYLQQNIAVLRSLSEVLNGIPENSLGSVDISKVMSMNEESLKSVFYNPFISGTEDRISVSTILKTAIVLSKAMSDGVLAPYQDYTALDETAQSKAFAEEMDHYSLPLIVKIIGSVAQSVVYKLGMVICSIILMLEYSITLIEFLLAGAVSTLLIPLYFIDSTKQYVTNFIRMILSYFIKLMVNIMMIFFVLGMYLRMAETMYTRVLSDTGSVVYYVFILVLGLVLAKVSGKIASAVINGSPSMGIGDVANQMRSFGHMAHTAGHAAQGMKHDLQNAAQKVPKAGGQVASFHANKRAAASAAEDARSAAKHSIAQKAASGEFASNMHSSDPAVRAQARKEVANQMREAGDMAYKNTMKSSMSEYNKEAMFRALTGMDRSMFGHKGNGRLQIGQEFWDGKKFTKATYDDCQKRNKQLAEIAGDQTVDEFLKSMKPEGESNQRKQDHDYNWPQPGM